MRALEFFFKRRSHDRKQPHKAGWWRWHWQRSSREEPLWCLWASSEAPPPPLGSSWQLFVALDRRSTSLPSCTNLVPPLVLWWKSWKMMRKIGYVHLLKHIYVCLYTFVRNVCRLPSISMLESWLSIQSSCSRSTLSSVQFLRLQQSRYNCTKQHSTWVKTNYSWSWLLRCLLAELMIYPALCHSGHVRACQEWVLSWETLQGWWYRRWQTEWWRSRGSGLHIWWWGIYWG